ncbi:MAG: type VI secretion system baseplate subunit TssF [Phycisphaerales bacterium]
MDRRLLRYYDRELRHLKTVAKEFATEFPKIAGRLAIEDINPDKQCIDPYVERLIEGYAFLAARVQLKLDAEFPRFTHNLLETVYPHYLAPTPSMCVVQMHPDPGEAGLADGFTIERGSSLRSQSGKDMNSCEYRTSHGLTVWPVTVAEAKYFTRDVGVLELNRVWGTDEVIPTAGRNSRPAAKAALRLRLKTSAQLPFNKVAMNDLLLYLGGGGSVSGRLYEQIFAHARHVIVRPVMQGNKNGNWQVTLPASVLSRRGFDRREALLPYDSRSFQGYRLVHEYFAFPQRFMFVNVSELRQALAKCDTGQIDVIISFDAEDIELDGKVSAEDFLTNCAPAVNLFPKRCDRIFVSDRATEFQVIPDRTKPLDYEVYRVLNVTGFGGRAESDIRFRPFYAATDDSADDQLSAAAFFAVNRVPRVVSERERRMGSRTSYGGSEVYLSLVDAKNTPYSPDLRQLSVEAMCTNRDLPLQMPVGKGRTDFTLDIGAPIQSIRIVAGPTPPRASYAEGDASWRLVSHLSLNYLSMTDEDIDGDGQISNDERQGAASLRDLLKLYGSVGDPTIKKQIDGIRGIQTKTVTRRVPNSGAIAFARGLEVTLTMEEAMFEGTGVFLLGAVLEQFFARYVTMNSFTETVIRTVERGEIMRWKVQVGTRPLL